jgi:hypothetical protein
MLKGEVGTPNWRGSQEYLQSVVSRSLTMAWERNRLMRRDRRSMHPAALRFFSVASPDTLSYTCSLQLNPNPNLEIVL